MRSAAICLILAGACGQSEDPKSRPLWSDGTHLRDADGRVAILRGVNARVDGVFDVGFSDGRAALEPIPPLTSDDCRRMRELGFDLLRLPINWSGVEPRDGELDEGYLSRVDAAVQCAAGAGIVTLIDLHQDAYSKEIGEDGAPLWAISPPPTKLLGGPLTDLGTRRTSSQVTSAFQAFFRTGDPTGLQGRFITMLAHVAARFADDPAVVGFELFNEPIAGDDDVTAFHIAAAEAAHRAAPAKLIFFEPSALRNLIDFAPLSPTPFPVAAAVYSPHVYTFVFLPDPARFETATPADLEPSVLNARMEARAWSTPLLIGEFGLGPSADPQNELWMQTQAQLHDRYFASDAFWLWKERSQGSWGVFDHVAASDTWTERPQVVAWVSRVHVARVAGTPTIIESTPLGDAIHVEIAPGSATTAPHLIYIPERFAATARARCDGAEVATVRDPSTGLISLACRGVLDVGP